MYSICHSQQSDKGLHCFPFSAVWSGSTRFVILSLIRVYAIWDSFLAVLSRSLLFAILSSLIRVYTVCHYKFEQSLHCHSQQSDLGLHCLPLSVWTESTLFVILSSFIKVKVDTVILRNSLIRVQTICNSQQSIMVYIICHYQQSDQNQGPYCHSQEQSDQGLQYFPFSVVWSGSTQFAILSSLIRVYTVWHSQQSDLGLHCLLFSAVWSTFTLFTILSSLIRVYIVCHSQQSDQRLHCFPFSTVW